MAWLQRSASSGTSLVSTMKGFACSGPRPSVSSAARPLALLRSTCFPAVMASAPDRPKPSALDGMRTRLAQRRSVASSSASVEYGRTTTSSVGLSACCRSSTHSFSHCPSGAPRTNSWTLLVSTPHHDRSWCCARPQVRPPTAGYRRRLPRLRLKAFSLYVRQSHPTCSTAGQTAHAVPRSPSHYICSRAGQEHAVTAASVRPHRSVDAV